MERYLKICEQTGREPDPDRVPLEPHEFPMEVQLAFFLFDLLTDRYEGMSGSYMGKDWSSIGFIFELYEVDHPKVIYMFMKVWENIIVSYLAKKSQDKAKAEKAKAQRSNSV